MQAATRPYRWILVLAAVALAAGCSINRLAVNVLAGSLGSGSSDVFTGDNDPQLVGEALPFALKLYETLLVQAPDNTNLLLTTGSGFVMYANAFVQTPASMLPDTEWQKQQEMLVRAKKLYLRGRDYLLRGMELRHPGFRQALEEKDNAPLDTMLPQMKVEDVPWLYWTAASWLGAFSTDTFDIALLVGVQRAHDLVQRALELDESFNDGALHELLISYYGGVPASMGGSEEKAREQFRRAVQLSEGRSASPYVALATTVDVAKQDAQEFRSLLEQALAIDPDATPSMRLLNILTQRKARWLLEHIEDFFLITDEGTGGEEGGAQ